MPIEYSINSETKEFPQGCHEVPAGGFKQIGKTRSGRKDGLMKAAGSCVYVRDLNLPGMLIAKPLLSVYPHAKITSMNTSKAEAYPGVRYVLRYDNPRLTAKKADGTPVIAEVETGQTMTYICALPQECHAPANIWGAVVIADTEDAADEALDLIEVQYELLPYILGTEEAALSKTILDPAGHVRSSPDTNVRTDSISKLGDIEAGFKAADKVVECVADETHTHAECPAEELVSVARFREDYLEIWSHNQQPHVVHNYIGQYYPQSKVRSYGLYNGAQFGWQNWTGAYLARHFPILNMICAEMVKPRPVKLIFDKDGFSGVQETEGTHYFKIGIKNDGKLTAYQATLYGRSVGKTWHEHNICENYDVHQIDAYRNQGIRVCYRHGYQFGSNGQTFPFGHACAAIGLDPTKQALISNGCEDHDMAWVAENVKKPQGFDPTRDSLKECLAAGKKAIDWDNKWHAPGTKILPNGKYHGMGFSWFHEWTYGFRGKDGGATGLRVLEDGTVCIMIQNGDIGCATATAYSTVVADELGVPYNQVDNWIEDDWENISHDGGCGGALIATAPAMAEASRKMRKLIFEAATTDCVYARGTTIKALFPGKKPEELDMVDGIVFEKANPSNKKTLKEVSLTCGSVSRSSLRGVLQTFGWCSAPEPMAYYMKGLPGPAMVLQCHFIEVEVDPETGVVDITKVVNVNDVGKAINPDVCKGQQYGGSYMGLGDGAVCEMVYDPQTGALLNDNYASYQYFKIKDISGPMEQILVETGLGYGNYGNAGIGETIAAMTYELVNQAVHNAIGKWVDAKPVNPQRVLKSLGKA